MNFEGHFDQIVALLKPHMPIWYEEVLNYYPNALEHYPYDWVEQLQHLSHKELWQLDGKHDPSILPKGPLRELIENIQALTWLRRASNPPAQLSHWAMVKVKGKKSHEIKRLLPIIKKLNTEHSFSHAVDIGGGVGHLARTLAFYGDLPCYSLDCDKNFQASGKKRANKYPPPNGARELNFVNMTFGRKETSNRDEQTLAKLFAKGSFSIGLHTCGPLAISHLKANLKYNSSGLLNFGCCYAKMDPDTDLNLSNYAKKNPLHMTTHTLTLATRGHTEMSYQDFLLKERVKTHRYTLHLLLYYKLGVKEFVSAGELPVKLYWKNFSVYAKNRLAYLGIDCPLSDNELDDFAGQREIKEKVRWMFLANIIRWQFGRIIEHYILTDRCLYLKERGHRVEMLEYFDEKISPRNIGILAMKS